MFLGTTQFGGTKVFGGTATESLPVAKGLSYATVTPQQGRTQGVGVKAPPLKLDILQKRYHLHKKL